jgi:hypothetical protein
LANNHNPKDNVSPSVDRPLEERNHHTEESETEAKCEAHDHGNAYITAPASANEESARHPLRYYWKTVEDSPEAAMVAEEEDGSKSAGPEQPPDLNSRDEESIESPDQMREATSDSDKQDSSKGHFDCVSGKLCENHRLERQHKVGSFSVVNQDRRIPACYC